MLIRTTPYSEHAILHAIGLMLLLAVAMMSVARLDVIIESTGGAIATEEGPLYVQPLAEGIVRQIMVKVGDAVTKGQVLATLDPTFAAADMNQLQEHFESVKAQAERLEAENEDRPYIPIGGGKYELLQQTQWRQRQEEYKQTVAGFEAQILATRAQLEQGRRDVANYTTRQDLNYEIQHMRTALERHGNASHLAVIQATDARVEISRLLEAGKQQIDQYTHTLDYLAAQRAVYVETWRETIANQLVTARNDLEQTTEALKKARRVDELITLTAPDDAIVFQIASASVGSIVQPSIPSATSNLQQPLFTLTPLDSPTEALLEVDSADVAFIRIGDPVILKVDAFPYIRFGTGEGAVKAISEGSFTLRNDGTIRSPFFKVWVEVKKLNFRGVPSTTRLIPGMTVTGDIKVGRRSMLSYLVEGVLRNADEAMREP